MPARIYRVWIDVDEYDPDTDEWQDIAINLGPAAEFAGETEGGRARAQAAAVAFAEHLQAAAALVLAEAGTDVLAFVDVHNGTIRTKGRADGLAS